MSNPLADWQLPEGVDRGLWDYLHSEEMVQGYDDMMQESPLARQDVAYCERVFGPVGEVVDLGCGTARLAIHLAKLGHRCTAVDLSPVMLARARRNAEAAGLSIALIEANLIDLKPLAEASFDYAACLFSTLGMIRGADNRLAALRAIHRILRPAGQLVLHIHRRWFRGLGWGLLVQQTWRTLIGSPNAGDITMSQHYAGSPLTLHHFTWGEIMRLIREAGFTLKSDEPIREAKGVYGYLLHLQKS